MTVPCWWTRSARYIGVTHFKSCFNLSLLNSAGYFIPFPKVSIAKSKIAQQETEESIRNSATHHCLYCSKPEAYLTHESWKWGNEMFWALDFLKKPTTQLNSTWMSQQTFTKNQSLWSPAFLTSSQQKGGVWPFLFKTEIMLEINCWQKHKALLRRNYRHFRG